MARQRFSGQRIRWGFGEWYPNQYATSRVYPNNRQGPVTVDTEVHSIRCAQCGYPIKDRRRIETCPHCASDNFDGQDLSG